MIYFHAANIDCTKPEIIHLNKSPFYLQLNLGHQIWKPTFPEEMQSYCSLAHQAFVAKTTIETLVKLFLSMVLDMSNMST